MNLDYIYVVRLYITNVETSYRPPLKITFNAPCFSDKLGYLHPHWRRQCGSSLDPETPVS